MSKANGLFREKSLQRLSSPERLDQLMQVTRSTDWLILACLAGLIAIALAWSILGSVPTTVSGRGVLIFPRTVTQFQAPAAGRILQLMVTEGATVKKGQVVGLLEQPDLQGQLQQQYARLADLQVRERTADQLNSAGRQLSKRAIASQRQDLRQAIADNAVLVHVLKQQFDSARGLREKGLVAETLFVQTQQAYFGKLRELHSQRAQLTDLDAREQEIDRQVYAAATVWAQQRADIEQQIRLIQKRLGDTGRILSPEDGRILTISVNRGTYVEAGRTIGTVQKLDSSSRLVALAFFVDGDGKRIKAGMKVQITPDTVEQQRFGSIVGSIARGGEFPITPAEVAALVGKEELASLLTAGERHIQVMARLKLDPTTFSGYRWTTSAGPRLKIANSTTCRMLVIVEERPPITYVVPLLRSLTGIR
jgi:HlyD family secretion protein